MPNHSDSLLYQNMVYPTYHFDRLFTFTDIYDHAITAGTTGPEGVQGDAFLEIIRVVKPGMLPWLYIVLIYGYKYIKWEVVNIIVIYDCLNCFLQFKLYFNHL